MAIRRPWCRCRAAPARALAAVGGLAQRLLPQCRLWPRLLLRLQPQRLLPQYRLWLLLRLQPQRLRHLLPQRRLLRLRPQQLRLPGGCRLSCVDSCIGILSLRRHAMQVL